MRLPNQLRKLWSRISLKVAVVVTGMFAVLVLMMLGIVLGRSRQAFIDVVQRYDRYGYVFLEKRRIPIVEGQILPPQSYIDGPGEPADQQFVDRYVVLIVWAAVIGLVGALAIGLFISRLLTRPLYVLSTGIKKLRHNHYRSRLSQDGPAEFKPLVVEFNQLAAELERIEKLRKTLISDTSHELKTPVTSLLTQLQGMKDGVITPDRSHFERLVQEAERLNALIDSLHEYSRLRSEAAKPRRENVQLNEVIERARRRLEYRLQEARLELLNTVPTDFLVSADPEQLERVVMNILENAIRYSQASQVKVDVRGRVLSISDNGVGIPSEHWPYLFERFYRVDPSRNRQTGGLGLGLAIVKEIIDNHAWTIEVGRPESGPGTAFRITFESDRVR